MFFMKVRCVTPVGRILPDRNSYNAQRHWINVSHQTETPVGVAIGSLEEGMRYLVEHADEAKTTKQKRELLKIYSSHLNNPRFRFGQEMKTVAEFSDEDVENTFRQTVRFVRAKQGVSYS